MSAARCLVVCALSAFLASCARTPPPPPSIDFTQMHCVKVPDLGSATTLVYDPKKDKQTPVVLDGKMGCLDSANGVHTLYKVFELPDTDASYILRVSAAPWGDTILAPRVVLLDDKGVAKRTTSRADFTFRGNSLVTLMRSHADEKYLVLSSDADVLGNSVSRINENVQQAVMAAGPVFFQLYTGSDSTTNLTLSPAGNANVVISPLPAN